jgi:DNA gyrase subunit A
MRLQRLTGLERDKIEQEYREILDLIIQLRALVENRELRLDKIKEETLEIKDKFADPRRTAIIEGRGGSFNMED